MNRKDMKTFLNKWFRPRSVLTLISLVASLLALFLINAKLNLGQLEYSFDHFVSYIGMFFGVTGVVLTLYFVILGVYAHNIKDEIVTTKNDTKAAKDSLSSATQELNAARQEMSVVKDGLENVKNELNRVKSELSNTKVELSDATTELRLSKQELNTSKNELASSKNDLETTKNELSKAEDELKKSRVELNTVRGELSSVRSELNTVRSELEGTKTKFDTTKKELTLAKEEFKDTTKEIREREIRFNDNVDEVFSALSVAKFAANDIDKRKAIEKLVKLTQLRFVAKTKLFSDAEQKRINAITTLGNISSHISDISLLQEIINDSNENQKMKDAAIVAIEMIRREIAKNRSQREDG